MKLFKPSINLIKRVIRSWEDSRVPFVYFILTFFFATTLRNFLEVFSDHASIVAIKFIHYDISYVALALALILLFHLVTKTDIPKIARIILPLFIILNLAPLLDLILSLGKGYNIGYMSPECHPNLVLRFFTFFGDFPECGISPGIRSEVTVILLGSFIYFYLKSSNLIKSLFSTLLTYTLIFCYLATPILVKGILEFMGLEYEYSDLLMLSFYLLFIFLTGILLAYLTNRKYFKLLIKDIRPFRLAHFELMFIAGLALGIKRGLFDFNSISIFSFIFIPISIALAWFYSVIKNNIADYEIDKISNRDRPLINSKISLKAYEKLGWLVLFISLFYAAMVNFKAFFIILLFIGNYFLYSAPPLRLKRIPFFSKLLISLNSLILVMLGFMLSSPIGEFPRSIMAIFLIGFTGAINFIDIKDYRGDKRGEIKTLPVILGLKRAKFIIGLFFILTYLSVYFIVKESYLVFPFLILGLIQFYLINKRNYREKYVFSVYLFSLIMLIICLKIFKVSL